MVGAPIPQRWFPENRSVVIGSRRRHPPRASHGAEPKVRHRGVKLLGNTGTDACYPRHLSTRTFSRPSAGCHGYPACRPHNVLNRYGTHKLRHDLAKAQSMDQAALYPQRLRLNLVKIFVGIVTRQPSAAAGSLMSRPHQRHLHRNRTLKRALRAVCLATTTVVIFAHATPKKRKGTS